MRARTESKCGGTCVGREEAAWGGGFVVVLAAAVQCAMCDGVRRCGGAVVRWCGGAVVRCGVGAARW